ncbi:MAG: hypothetical protein KKB20_06200, partial [Proteobacteria bacterium]|nr:hypothetical protein [Pseudomonadota bacterium]
MRKNNREIQSGQGKIDGRRKRGESRIATLFENGEGISGTLTWPGFLTGFRGEVEKSLAKREAGGDFGRGHIRAICQGPKSSKRALRQG